MSVNEYSEYKFLIGESCEIIGVLEGEVTDTTKREDFIEIEEFDRNILQGETTPTLNTKITYEPNEYTNKESEKIVVKISNSKGIKSIKCPDNDIIYPQKDQTEVGIDYTVTKNESYTYVVTDSEGKEETLNMKVNIFDRVPPKDFTPVEVKNYSTSVIIKGNAEDGDETEESAKSGIAKYEYYVNGRKKGETEEEEFEITNLVKNTEYTIYVIAYDRAGNWKRSEEIKVTPTPKLYIYNLEDLKDFRDDVNKGYNYDGDTVKLMSDIDLGGKEEDPSTWWVPIGGIFNGKGNNFAGAFDGNGHKISNMYINSVEDELLSQATEIGFFGELLGKKSGVRNLCLENCFIEVNNKQDFVGMLVAYSREGVVIENCKVVGGKIVQTKIDESRRTNSVGGIAGFAGGVKLSRCSNSSYIQCEEVMYIGGIVGLANSYTLIEECYNIGDISDIGVANGGGISGTNDHFRNDYYVTWVGGIKNCYNLGNIYIKQR